MSRKPCCSGEGLKKGAWTTEEDKKLIAYIQEYGEGGWRDVPQKAGLKRCGKSCRLRWTNYLKPDIKRGEFSPEEEQIIIMLHASRGNKWSAIARHLPRRTDNEIKNYWNTHLKKRLIEQGINPVTHKPIGSSPIPSTPENSNSQDAPSPDEQSQSGSFSPCPIPQSSGFEVPEISSSDGTPPPPLGDSLNHKKRSSSSNFTSRLLNKVATRVTSMRGILSASMEGSLTNPTPSSSLSYIHNAQDHSQVSMTNEDFDLLFQSSLLYHHEHEPEHESRTLNSSETRTANFDLNGGNFNYEEYDLSQFLDSFDQNKSRDQMMSDVSSTTVDEDMISPLDGWSDYILDHPNFL